ncbi:MAG: hypothetical protein MUF51_00730 [Vicinamibacteria bacterium]|nr:hypothetical protein [Vicinamibacteria bacterium]
MTHRLALPRLRVARRAAWFRSAGFQLSCTSWTGITLAVAWACDLDIETILAQSVFIACAYAALFILADRPLLNPIQAMAALFIWWFAIGPVTTAIVERLLDSAAAGAAVIDAGVSALWIVAPGLLLYAVTSAHVLRIMERRQLHIPTFAHVERLLTSRFVLVAWTIGTLTWFSPDILSLIGIHGITMVYYLGGMRTDIWWVGVLFSLAQLRTLALSAAAVLLVDRRRQIGLLGAAILGALFVEKIASSLLSGWKSLILEPLAFLVCAHTLRRQRLPLALGSAGVLVFLLVVAPFVSHARLQSVDSSVDAEGRRDEFLRTLIEPSSWFRRVALNELPLRSLFRDIYPLAGRVVLRNTWLDGEWQGATVRAGLAVALPRAILPDKPDLDMGNFFARDVAAELQLADPFEYTNNAALSIPIEVVGNYGWLAGVLSFGVLGAAWTALVAGVLSARRIASHAFTPHFILLAMSCESSLGGFITRQRDLIFPLITAALILIGMHFFDRRPGQALAQDHPDATPYPDDWARKS